jgi:hypothetical protein
LHFSFVDPRFRKFYRASFEIQVLAIQELFPPFKFVDPSDVEKLASIGCTLKEIASFCGCSHDVIKRRS